MCFSQMAMYLSAVCFVLNILSRDFKTGRLKTGA